MWLASAVSAGLVIAVIRERRADIPSGPQHIPLGCTSRLGGMGVAVGFSAAVAIALVFGYVPIHPALPLIIASLPVLVVGLWEDLTHRVSPKYRLAAAMLAALLASVFADGVVPRLDIGFADRWLAYWPIAVPITCFMVAGACNAFNIIDGTNGLAGGTALMVFAGQAVVAWVYDCTIVLALSSAMVGALAGFLAWNYPRGRVFLGDAGAYFVGFMYAELSIQLVARNPGLSAWFVIALAGYPIAETLFSMYRRKVGHVAAMQPDTQHLHSLLYLYFLSAAERRPQDERRLRSATVPYSGRERRQEPQRRANARVAPRLWLHSALCLTFALLYYHNTPALVAFALIYGLYYWTCYRGLARLYGDRAKARATVPSAST
jgi:UDP-N-acetylmuramyl pentapeptide phosphotransferase/UDP-N-acetylglucosamine-1-phosphate transferase